MCFMDYLAANSSLFQLINCDEQKRTSAPRNTATTRLIIHAKDGANSNEEAKRKIEFVHIHDASHLVSANIIAAEN